MGPSRNIYHTSTGLDIERNKFVQLRKKRVRFLGHLHFLLTCKKKHIIPKFIRIKCSVPKTYRVRSTMERLHRILLRTVIKDCRSKLAKTEAQLYQLHLRLSKELSYTEWNTLDTISTAWSSSVSSNQQKTHKKKLLHLLDSKEAPTPGTCQAEHKILTNKKVLNISGIDIPDDSLKTLELGLNFTIESPINNIDVTSRIEQGFKNSKISVTQKDFLRAKISSVLLSNTRTHCNLSNNEKTSLKELKDNKEIIITPADKGGVIVILNKGQYVNGLKDILSNNSYCKILKNPVNKIMAELRSTVKSSTILDDVQKRALIPSYFRLGHMYILPKVHKPLLTFRPIVSTISTPCYALSKYLAKRLAPLAHQNTYSIKNSSEFVKTLRATSLNTSKVTMVSFDIVSLFSNVPIQGALSTLSKRLIEVDTPIEDADAILKLVEYCTRSTYFTANQEIFCQTKGLPMGGCLSPVLCDIYLHYLEDRIMSLPDNIISLWRRYVDDVFALISNNHLNIEAFTSNLNKLDTDIQFTYEVEVDMKIPFLDVLVEKTNTGFNTSVYRKPFAVLLPPHARSSLPMSLKVSVFYSFVKRAFEFCSHEDDLQSELNFLRAVATDRGFNASVIDDAVSKCSKFKPVTTLSKDDKNIREVLILPFSRPISSKLDNVLRKEFRIVYSSCHKIKNAFGPPKDAIPMCERWGVYFIPCKNCHLGYVGQTRRALCLRIREHDAYVRKCDTNRSNIAKHCWEEDHSFNFASAAIVHSTRFPSSLDHIEAFLITKFSKSLVNDNHFPFISHIWRDVIRGTPFKLVK